MTPTNNIPRIAEGGTELQEYTHENKEGDIIPFYLKHDVDRYINNLKEKVCSMFRGQDKCRGLDFKSVLGQIANVAFHHWLHVEKNRTRFDFS